MEASRLSSISIEGIQKKLQEEGFKLTLQRQATVEILLEHLNELLTAEEIYTEATFETLKEKIKKIFEYAKKWVVSLFAKFTTWLDSYVKGDLAYLKKYEKVVDIETLSLSMDLYRVKKGIQIATVRAELLLREFKDNKIKNRKEFLKLQLEKSEHCKTQAVCAPSILKCTKCGGNLSLLEGKICKFCGNELDMKEHDWVITEYSSMQEQK